MKDILRRQNLLIPVAKFLPSSLRDTSADIFQRALVDESGKIKTQIGTHNKS
jgi:hypothetical protein